MAVPAALMYGLGLSCSAVSRLLGALGCPIAKSTARRRPGGGRGPQTQARAGEEGQGPRADETVFKVKGREVVVGFVVDARLKLHLARPRLGLRDGTNNATERGIAKSKARHKTMRGYKSVGGDDQRHRADPAAS